MRLDTVILKESFHALEPVAEEVANMFFKALRKEHPEAERLFGKSAGGSSPTVLFNAVIRFCEEPKKLSEYLERVGSAHGRKKVETRQYEWAVESLLETLKQAFGDSWSERLEDAWMTTLGLVVETLKSANVKARANLGKRARMNGDSVEKDLKAEIDKVIREVILGALEDAASAAEIRETAKSHARAMLKEALQEQLNELRARFAARKAA